MCIMGMELKLFLMRMKAFFLYQCTDMIEDTSIHQEMAEIIQIAEKD